MSPLIQSRLKCWRCGPILQAAMFNSICRKMHLYIYTIRQGNWSVVLRWARVITVSYTHLVAQSGALSIVIVPCMVAVSGVGSSSLQLVIITTGAKSKSMIFREKDKILMSKWFSANEWHKGAAPEAVSYTHLDVYKRQVLALLMFITTQLVNTSLLKKIKEDELGQRFG